MRVMMEFVSTARQHNGWQDTKEIELPEGSTTADALAAFNTGFAQENGVSFLVVNGVMSRTDVPLEDGDRVKVFPKAFGG